MISEKVFIVVFVLKLHSFQFNVSQIYVDDQVLKSSAFPTMWQTVL